MKAIKNITLSALVLLIITTTSGFSYAYEVSSEDSDIRVDKFESNTKTELKTSKFAEFLNNGIAEKRNKGEKIHNNYKKQETKKEQNKPQRDTSTFRWF